MLAGFTAAALVALGYGPAQGIATLFLVSEAHASVPARLTPVADALALGSAEQGTFRYGWACGAGSAACGWLSSGREK